METLKEWFNILGNMFIQFAELGEKIDTHSYSCMFVA